MRSPDFNESPEMPTAAKKIGQDDGAARLRQQLNRIEDGAIIEPLYSNKIAEMLQASIEAQMAANRKGAELDKQRKRSKQTE